MGEVVGELEVPSEEIEGPPELEFERADVEVPVSVGSAGGVS